MRIVFRKRDSEFYFLIGLCLILLGFYLQISFNLIGNCFPAYHDIIFTDEPIYHLEALNVRNYTTFSSPYAYDGNLSWLGNFGAHGFAGSTFYGLLGKLIPSETAFIVYINLILTLLIFFAVSRYFRGDKLQKTQLLILMASNCLVFIFAFSYMQESVHMLLGVILSLYLYQSIYDQKENNYTQWSIFLSIILVGILFRMSWFVWIFALFPLLKTRKERIWMAVILLFLIWFSLFLNSKFFAPYTFSPLFVITWDGLKPDDIGKIFGLFLSNIPKFFMEHNTVFYIVYKYFYLFLLAWISVQAWKQPRSFYMAAALISWGMLALVFTTNDAYAYRDLRMLGCCYIPLVIAVIHHNNKWLSYGIISIQLFAFYSVYRYTENKSRYYRSNYFIAQSPVFKETINKLQSALPPDATILELPTNLLFNNNALLGGLPLRTTANQPILYNQFLNSLNVYRKNYPAYYMDLMMTAERNHVLILRTDNFKIYRY